MEIATLNVPKLVESLSKVNSAPNRAISLRESEQLRLGVILTYFNEFNQPLGNELNNWTIRKKPSHDELQGSYCVLEPITLNSDIKQLYNALSYENDGSSWTYLPYGPFNTGDEFSAWLHQTIAAEQDTLFYSIRKINELEPVGIIGYLRINPSHGVIEIGHVHFSKHLQRTPAATEAIYLMINHALETLQYRRCEWKCNALNQPSINAALRLGFTFEGTFRQSNVFKNQNRDTSWFSILDLEWPLLSEKIQRWLHPSNFDELGRQRASLASIMSTPL